MRPQEEKHDQETEKEKQEGPGGKKGFKKSCGEESG
jgi:hypothetical protein